MKTGHYWISTGFVRTCRGDWHILVAVHRRWRLDYLTPFGKPEYRRLYIGPLEFEWSRSRY